MREIGTKLARYIKSKQYKYKAVCIASWNYAPGGASGILEIYSARERR